MKKTLLACGVAALIALSCTSDTKTNSELMIKGNQALDAPQKDHSEAERCGFEFLTHGAYGAPEPSDEIFDNLWQVWDGEDAQKALGATKEQRKKLTYKRYGFLDAPYENGDLPMGFAKGSDGRLRNNCLVCHGGAVLGKPMVGAPNNRLDLQTFNEDLFLLTSKMQGMPATRPVRLPMQFGTGRGVTNAVVFSHILLSLRDKDLDQTFFPTDLGTIVNHDLDAPPWWHVGQKKNFYIDAFVPKDGRALIQFAMVTANTGEKIRDMLPDFENMLAYLNSLKPPVYPGKINPPLAARGKTTFEQRCAGCHANDALIPIAVVGTDDARLRGLTDEFIQYYKHSWLSDYGKIDVKIGNKGYVAPSLKGIWASAPYFHNGSVPTLEHVLAKALRPKIWTVPDYDAYDHERVGLIVQSVTSIPKGLTQAEARRYYDTSIPGKSNGGHLFGEGLTDDERKAVIEYLKTL